jgi:hypothetical protein
MAHIISYYFVTTGAAADWLILMKAAMTIG